MCGDVYTSVTWLAGYDNPSYTQCPNGVMHATVQWRPNDIVFVIGFLEGKPYKCDHSESQHRQEPAHENDELQQNKSRIQLGAWSRTRSLNLTSDI